jgi:hypothetical protein
MPGDATTVASEARATACEKCQELLNAFGDTVSALLILIEQDLQAVLSETPECANLKALIAIANQNKQEAKDAYLRHAKTHTEARAAA